jgi:hypothetical protein
MTCEKDITKGLRKSLLIKEAKASIKIDKDDGTHSFPISEPCEKCKEPLFCKDCGHRILRKDELCNVEDCQCCCSEFATAEELHAEIERLNDLIIQMVKDDESEDNEVFRLQSENEKLKAKLKEIEKIIDKREFLAVKLTNILKILEAKE